MIIDLRPTPKPNLRELEVGDSVITSKGFEFQLVSRKDNKESWLDLTTGITWHDIEDRYTHYQAVKKFGNKLPAIEEFLTAEEHGFREVLPDMDHWFWSASLSPNYQDFVQVFNGNNGNSDYVKRDNFVSVRCVDR